MRQARSSPRSRRNRSQWMRPRKPSWPCRARSARRGGPPAAKGKAKAKAKGKAKAKAKPMKAVKDTAKGYKAKAAVCYCHEASRQQFLGRCRETSSAVFSYKGKSKNAVESQVKAPSENVIG